MDFNAISLINNLLYNKNTKFSLRMNKFYGISNEKKKKKIKFSLLFLFMKKYFIYNK